MTVEQFALLGLLAKEGLKFQPREAVELDHETFVQSLRDFTWDVENPPYEIAPNLVTRYDGMDYKFDIYRFQGYRVNIYYSLSESPPMFVVWGEGGVLIFLRGWAP